MGQISRTIYDQYHQYHTSGDNKKFMNIKQLVKSIDTIENILKVNDWIFLLKDISHIVNLIWVKKKFVS